ncbi:MAG: HEAT repeat domain-containing protein [Isosphaeraceae bacterium]|nr:HEAT repeat domain-containing protein [Isosphaeraceae bacterium]
MAARRRTRIWVAGVLGLAVAGAIAVGLAQRGHRPRVARPLVVIDENSPLATLAPALREGDGRALAVLQHRLSTKTETPPAAISEAEAEAWLETLAGLRAGFLRFGGYGRATALGVAGKVFERLAVDPAPTDWIKTLQPAHDVLTAGLADTDLDVRVSALMEVGRLWSWIPGTTPDAHEQEKLDAWKEGLVGPVTRRLSDREPKSRAAAVACLGLLPVNASAMAAIPYLEDKESGAVRQQVLVSFAHRNALLTEDAIARHLYDPEPNIPETAETVLKIRGLTREQISLARLINHPKPGMRASVIPLLKNRTDVDPVVWLIQLSRDNDESVRTAAAEALNSQGTSEARARLVEIVREDQSASVRAVAAKLLGLDLSATAALPPLPGSPSLNPKAN